MREGPIGNKACRAGANIQHRTPNSDVEQLFREIVASGHFYGRRIVREVTCRESLSRGLRFR